MISRFSNKQDAEPDTGPQWHPNRPVQEHLQPRELLHPQRRHWSWKQLGGWLLHGRDGARGGSGHD